MIKVHDLIYQKELNSNILFKFLVKITVDISQIITQRRSNQLHKSCRNLPDLHILLHILFEKV